MSEDKLLDESEGKKGDQADDSQGDAQQLDEKQKSIIQLRKQKNIIFWIAVIIGSLLFLFFAVVSGFIFYFVCTNSSEVRDFLKASPFSILVVSVLLIVPSYILCSVARSVYGGKEDDSSVIAMLARYLLSNRS